MNKKHLRLHLAIIICTVTVLLLCWQFDVLDFYRPDWLFALLVLPIFTWIALKGIAGLPSKTNAISTTVRHLLFIIIVVALADIQFVQKNNNITVFYLIDYSASIPEATRDKAIEYVNASFAKSDKKENDMAGIILFGDDASVDILPVRDLFIEELHSFINPNYTNLQNAVDLAAAAFPSKTRKKIILITDGNQNNGDILEATRAAAAENIELDVLAVSYLIQQEVLVEKVGLPEKLHLKEAFDMSVHINSIQSTPATLLIFRNDVEIIKQEIRLKSGENTFILPVRIKTPGFYKYTARIVAPNDTIVENNESSNFVYIQGESRVLFVTEDGDDHDVEHLVAICGAEELETKVIGPDEFPVTLGELQAYDLLVLANVDASNFSSNQMLMVKSYVNQLRGGLIMLGGENSFGAGGYELTPIEEVLPVRMDIRQKKIIPKGALVIVLHTCEFAKGNYWGKQITKAAIDTVNRQDDVGVLFYGYQGGDQWLFDLTSAANKGRLKIKVDKCNPGDMPSFGPSFQMAVKSFAKSDAMVKHMIIISDGDPARPAPADVKNLAANNITVSTIGINPHSARDVDVLKYIAAKTKGRFYNVKDPKTLPQIFVKEAKVVKRSLIFNQPFQPKLTINSELTKGIRQSEIPLLLAYVATTPKDRALVSIKSDNENEDPILVQWRSGLGKSVAFTSDASSNWAKHWIGWAKYKKIWSQIIRWTARKRDNSNVTITKKIIGDEVVMTIDAIDEKGNYINFNSIIGRRVDTKYKGHNLEVKQTAPGRYEARFKIKDMGVNLVNVAYTNPLTNKEGFIQSGVSIPYSSEYKKLTTNLPLLKKVASIGSSKKVILNSDPALANIFSSPFPPAITPEPIWEYLLAVAVLIFMMDVIVRRVILRREDLKEAFAELPMFQKRRRESAEQDDTMSALLRRKEEVFKESDQDFKKSLTDKAEAGDYEKVDAVSSDAETNKPASYDDSSTRVESHSKDSDSSATTSSSPASSGDDESYTSRLLAAKRRARKDEEESKE